MRDFNHSVNVLVKAYFDETLEHGDCAKCAVGNIIHEATGLSFGEEYCQIKGTSAVWKALFYTMNGKQWRLQEGFEEERKEAIEAVRATGYTVKELARIEFAFETADKGHSSDDYMFNGLMAVVSVLAEIHGVNLEEKKRAELLFIK